MKILSELTPKCLYWIGSLRQNILQCLSPAKHYVPNLIFVSLPSKWGIVMEQNALKNVNNCWKTIITFNLDIWGHIHNTSFSS